MNTPSELKYTKDHEWLRVEGATAVVGITDFAQSQLGDIVFVDVATVGETVEQHSVFGTIEAVKTVSDLFSPVGGEVTGRYLFDAYGDTAEATEMATIHDGTASISGLPHGIYDIIEVEAPAGYTMTGQRMTVYITDGFQSVSQTIVNPIITGRLEVLKVDAASINVGGANAYTPLPGAVISLYSYDNSFAH